MNKISIIGFIVILSSQIITGEMRETLFNEICQIVDKNFYDSTFNKVDWTTEKHAYAQKIVSAVSDQAFAANVNALLSKLNTSHTYYYTPADQGYYHLTDLFKDAPPLKSSICKIFKNCEVAYTDIGIFTMTIDNEIFVSAVLDSSPAFKSGILAGDRIISVNGKPYEPVNSFKGKANTKVEITIQRTKNSSSRKSIIVEPESFKPNEMFYNAMKKSARLISNGNHKIGYVHVWSFAGEQYYDLLKELMATKLKDGDALILDIRDGYGGASPEYLNIFNSRIPHLKQQFRNGQTWEQDPQWTKPVVLLINGGTRSGKEIIAYAFRKYGYGKIVGSRTAGAVRAGRPFYLSDGSMLFLAVGLCTIDGEDLEGKGVGPDINVPQLLQYCGGKDIQLEKSVEIAVSQIK